MSSRIAVVLVALIALIVPPGAAGAATRNKLIGKWVERPLERLGMRGVKFTPDDGFMRRHFQKGHIQHKSLNEIFGNISYLLLGELIEIKEKRRVRI
jgi:hypothetical protein